jgi:hypothetical protein
MNYQRIYASIVLRAQSEDAERRLNKKINGAYYEVHHIIPKSLGGTDKKSNLAVLTAKEHFICHWLLVKIYPDGSDSQSKMLIAFWRMRSSSESQRGNRYINARAYESLRIKYATAIGKLVSAKQRGEGNSHYGMHWYTSADDGSVRCSDSELSFPWVKGRNLFRGESNYLEFDDDGKSISRKHAISSNQLSRKHKRIIKIKCQPASPKRNTGFDQVTQINDIKINRIHARESKAHIRQLALDATRKVWDEFHSGLYASLGDWAKIHGVTYQALRKRFKKHIPIFNELCKHGVYFSSDKKLIGVYETDG